MSAFLVTYKPLAISARGRNAASQFGLPAFVDSSCRREPDLESAFPSISAICRLSKFAPRLKKDDEILYLTVKSSFGQPCAAHYRVVAHLKVKEMFSSHSDAAIWYTNQGHAIPSNCMVSGSAPIPYARTSGFTGRVWRSQPEAAKLKFWDGTYRKRSRQIGAFLACEALWLDLHQPPKILVADLIEIFGRVPGTQTPPEIGADKIIDVLKRAKQNGA
jgi:hypothetical protein